MSTTEPKPGRRETALPDTMSPCENHGLARHRLVEVGRGFHPHKTCLECHPEHDDAPGPAVGGE